MRVGSFLSVVALVAGGALVATGRAPLAESFRKETTRSDVYPLPSPQQTLALSLGYRAALADLIFAHLLVSQGLHFQEKRLFEFVGQYLETVIELDPKFRAPYMYADTLLTMQPVPPPPRFYFKAREIFERGMRELPYDAELHLNAGQYMMYLGVNGVEKPEERQEWRDAGARAVARSCEVLGNQRNIPHHCLSAVSVFEKQGERQAMVQFVTKVLAVVDDPEVRERALRYLAAAEGEEAREAARRRFQERHTAQLADLPFASPDFYGLLPPKFDPTACAGTPYGGEPSCATTWRDRFTPLE